MTLPDFDLEFEEVPVLVQGFRRMVRELAYDVCEMALTTYICARAHGVEVHRAADLPGARLPPRARSANTSGRGIETPGRSGGPARGREPRLHGHDRRLGAVDPARTSTASTCRA